MLGGNASWLVLKLDNHQPWTRGTYAEKNVTDVFGKGHDLISVWKACSEFEESQIAAALWASNPSAGKAPLHILRVPSDPLNVEVLDEVGEVHFPSLNGRHRNLQASLWAFDELAQFLLSRIGNGEGLVRCITGSAIEFRVEEFLSVGDVKAGEVNGIRQRLQSASQVWGKGVPVNKCPAAWQARTTLVSPPSFVASTP